MSKLSELLIEAQETGKAPSLADTVNSVTLEAPKNPSTTWPDYWRLCLEVVIAAGDLASKDKLLMNLRDRSKAFNVKPVLEKYYNGDTKQLKSARDESVKTFFYAVDQVNWYARRHDLAQVSAMKLLGFLEDEKSREKFRHHIKRHIENGHPPFELDELPSRDFRKTSKSN